MGAFRRDISVTFLHVLNLFHAKIRDTMLTPVQSHAAHSVTEKNNVSGADVMERRMNEGGGRIKEKADGLGGRENYTSLTTFNLLPELCMVVIIVKAFHIFKSSNTPTRCCICNPK